jgi:hypothetical protein
MNTKFYKLYFLGLFLSAGLVLTAGNPDRQGEAGASELLMNPWAISSGFHSMNTASISGVEAMRLNPAGLSRIGNGEFILAHSQLYSGAELSMNAGGFATKMGTNGTIGISLVSLNFGEIPITTTEQPEGTGGTFSPNFFNIGLGYSYLYDNKISVGVLVRGVSESLPAVTAFGFAIDAGVQYVSGEKDNFKLGISLRNTGSPMKFSGQGLATNVSVGEGTLTLEQRSEDFELPSMLNLGISYDFYVSETDYIRALGNFTSNAFSQDQVGFGLEYSFKDIFQVRGAYKHNLGAADTAFEDDIYTGVAAGFTARVPLSKENKEKRLAIDYAYRATNPFKGTHNIGLRYIY